MTQDKTTSPEKKYTEKTIERKDKEPPPTKVVVRRLPPSLTADSFLEQVSPLPNYENFYFSKADLSLGRNAFTRAYITFATLEDVILFRDKFDDYVFVDSKGHEFPAMVEFAPFQKVPKRRGRKSDTKKGTIDQDPDYLKFVELLENPEEDSTLTVDSLLEEIEAKEKSAKAGKQIVNTPLIEFIIRKRDERRVTAQRIRDDKRRRELERLRQKDEERRKRREREEKPRDKDKSKEQDLDNEDSPVMMKLLKNPDRDARDVKADAKEFKSDKTDLPKAKFENDKSKERLRFSKENRERAAREKERTQEKMKSVTKDIKASQRNNRDDRTIDRPKSDPVGKTTDRPKTDLTPKQIDRPKSDLSDRVRDKVKPDASSRPAEKVKTDSSTKPTEKTNSNSSVNSSEKASTSSPTKQLDKSKNNSSTKPVDKLKANSSSKSTERTKTDSAAKGDYSASESNTDKSETQTKAPNGKPAGKPPSKASQSKACKPGTISDLRSQNQYYPNEYSCHPNETYDQMTRRISHEHNVRVDNSVKSDDDDEAQEGGKGEEEKEGDGGSDRSLADPERKTRRKDRPERALYVPRKAREAAKQDGVAASSVSSKDKPSSTTHSSKDRPSSAYKPSSSSASRDRPRSYRDRDRERDRERGWDNPRDRGEYSHYKSESRYRSTRESPSERGDNFPSRRRGDEVRRDKSSSEKEVDSDSKITSKRESTPTTHRDNSDVATESS